MLEDPGYFFEDEARRCGYRVIAGIDEAGRGPLAGPVVAAAVILTRRLVLEGLQDSKQVPHGERVRLYHALVERARGWAVGCATHEEIEALNIVEATRLAMTRAVAALVPSPDFLLLDAITLPRMTIPQRSVIRGDSLSYSIAAASIVAKVTRDRLMDEYHQRFPHYKFHLHKGYPTAEHLRLLALYGPCEIHRRSFGPVRAYCSVEAPR